MPCLQRPSLDGSLRSTDVAKLYNKHKEHRGKRISIGDALGEFRIEPIDCTSLTAEGKVAVLPKGSFPTTLAQLNSGPLSEKGEIIRNDEFGVLKKATASLKCSNTVPQTMEIEAIELFCKKCSRDIFQDDEYIRRLQSQINGLLEQIQATQARQARIQNLSDYFKPIRSPVRRLPPEILTTIFQFCLPTDAGPRSRAPLVLCHVSSLWRSIALGSPQLWSRLFLDFRRTPASKYGEILRFWFRHSRNQPRSLCYHHQYPPGSQPGLQQWSEDLKTTSALVRTLECIYLDPEHLLPFLQLPSSDVPLLEAVHLVSTRECNEVITVLETAPRLRLVHIDTCSSSFEIVLPWSQLTSLRIHDSMDAAYWAAVFAQCLQLRYGSFEVRFPPSGDFASSPRVILERLEVLCLTIEDKANLFQNYFRTLDLPNLQHFSLTNSFFKYDDYISFCDIAPCPNLKSLCLQGMHMEEDDLSSLFSVTPTLECLALDISSLGYLSISALLHENRALLPNLSRLYVAMSYDDLTMEPKGICSAIKSRLHDSSSLFVPLKHASLFLQCNEWRDDEGDDDDANSAFGFSAADMVERASAVIMGDSHSDDVDLHMKLVHSFPRLADIFEKTCCGWSRDRWGVLSV